MVNLDKTTIYRVLNNKGSEKETEAVCKWLATNEGQEWLSSALSKDAELLETGVLPLEDNVPVEDMIRIILARINRKRRRRFIFGAAAVCIPCVVMIALWANINKRLGGVLHADSAIETLVTCAGEKKEVIFQDGTSVKLNSATTIEYPHRFGIAERRIKLDGEAYFDVESNNLRPFIVEMANNTEIKVIGTKFNVEAYNESAEICVTLIDGCIEFKDNTQKTVMSPNEYLEYNKNTQEITIVTRTDASRNTLWTENTIVFRDTPMIRVLKALERQYGIHFSIEDEATKEYQYSLKISTLSSLDEILKDIESISDVEFIKRDSLIFVYQK